MKNQRDTDQLNFSQPDRDYDKKPDRAKKNLIDLRFLDFNRDHDRDQKPDPDQSRSGFYLSIDPGYERITPNGIFPQYWYPVVIAMGSATTLRGKYPKHGQEKYRVKKIRYTGLSGKASGEYRADGRVFLRYPF
jgi:hypothetical protein